MKTKKKNSNFSSIYLATDRSRCFFNANIFLDNVPKCRKASAFNFSTHKHKYSTRKGLDKRTNERKIFLHSSIIIRSSLIDAALRGRKKSPRATTNLPGRSFSFEKTFHFGENNLLIKSIVFKIKSNKKIYSITINTKKRRFRFDY